MSENNKEEKIYHLNFIPSNEGDVKRALDLMFQLTDQQRRVYYQMVRVIVNTMNESGMHKWFPDQVKPLFPQLFAYAISQCKDLRDAFLEPNEEQKQQEVIEILKNSNPNNLFPGLIQ